MGRLRKFPALRNSENMRNLTIKVVDSAWDQVIAVGTPTTEGGTEDPHIRYFLNVANFRYSKLFAVSENLN